MGDLTSRETLYVDLRCRGASPLEAALRLTNSAPELTAVEMEGNPRVAEALELNRQAMQSRRARIKETAADAVTAIIGADPRDLVFADGAPRLVHQLDTQTALAVQSIDITETTTPFGEKIRRTRYTFYNKLQAIKLLVSLGGNPSQQDNEYDDLTTLTDEQLRQYQLNLLEG